VNYTGEKQVRGCFQVKAGKIQLEYDAETDLATAEIPHNHRVHKSNVSQSELLRLQPSIIQAPSIDSPVVSIVNGMTWVLVELPSLESLGSVTAGPIKLAANLDEGWSGPVGQYFFFRDGQKEDTGITTLRTRMMAAGGWEDPATGSAASALASYLAQKEGAKNEQHTFVVTQGVEMGRKCVIKVKVVLDTQGTITKVFLSGSAIDVMTGNVRIPAA